MTKVDIASMGNSLECRAPFLDYRVVEFAASLPVGLKYRFGRGKRLLKRINRWAIAAAVALAGLFSFVAAETSHGKTTNSTTTSLQQPASSPSSPH